MTLRIAALSVLVLLGGCVTVLEPEGGREAPQSPIEFPDHEGKMWASTSVLHEVAFSFEMDRPPAVDEEPMLGRFPGGTETYGVSDPKTPSRALHRFSYEGGKFRVGEFFYPAQRNGVLFVFGAHEGPFTFQFHGRSITFDMGVIWKPAVLYHRVTATEEVEGVAKPASRSRGGAARKRTVTQVLGEEVQVGPHRIAIATGADTLEINGNKMKARPGATISINRRGDVKATQ